MMKMVVEIGYKSYVVDPRDAIVLLDIAARSIQVERLVYGKPWQQTVEQAPFIDSASLAEYEPLALPVEPSLPSIPAPPALGPSTESPDIPF